MGQTVLMSILIFAMSTLSSIGSIDYNMQFIDYRELPYIDYREIPKVYNFLQDEYRMANYKLYNLIDSETIFENDKIKIILLSYPKPAYVTNFNIIKVDKNYNDIIIKNYDSLYLDHGGGRQIVFNQTKNKILFITTTREGNISRSKVNVIDIDDFTLIENDTIDSINELGIPILEGNRWINTNTIELQVPILKTSDYETIYAWLENPKKRYNRVKINIKE